MKATLVLVTILYGELPEECVTASNSQNLLNTPECKKNVAVFLISLRIKKENSSSIGGTDESGTRLCGLHPLSERTGNEAKYRQHMRV